MTSGAAHSVSTYSGRLEYDKASMPSATFAFVSAGVDALQVTDCHAYILVPAQVRVQLNLLIYNLSKADFVEFAPDPFNMNIVRIHRDDEYLDRIVPILRDFHNEVTEYRAKGIETHPKYKMYRRRG